MKLLYKLVLIILKMITCLGLLGLFVSNHYFPGIYVEYLPIAAYIAMGAGASLLVLGTIKRIFSGSDSRYISLHDLEDGDPHTIRNIGEEIVLLSPPDDDGEEPDSWFRILTEEFGSYSEKIKDNQIITLRATKDEVTHGDATSDCLIILRDKLEEELSTRTEKKTIRLSSQT
jgi:hypothetical protein